MSKQYETVIGLEVHVELATKTKIFCSCSTEFGGAPNTHTCPVCTGMPGSLPVLNKQVVEYAAAVGLATNCTITQNCKFDLQHISHTVHIDGTLPFLTLKLCLHILLQTCFTNQVVGIIIFILFFQRIQLILVRLANISNDICKIFRIGIRTQTALLNIHSLQITLVFQDLCNCGI